MDPFLAIVVGLVMLVVIALGALGVWHPGTGTTRGDRSAGRARADQEAARDAEDLAQMLEAANARRRARGEPELTVEGLLAEQRARRADR